MVLLCVALVVLFCVWCVAGIGARAHRESLDAQTIKTTYDLRVTKTKRYRTTLWLVHNLISNIVPKQMGVPFVWRLKLAHYVPKIGKSNKKRCLATI